MYHATDPRVDLVARGFRPTLRSALVSARRWAVLATIWIGGIAAGWAWYFTQKSRAEDARQARLDAWISAARQVAAVAPDGVPSRYKADAQRLMADVQALAFERKSDEARAKARGHVAHALQRIGYRPELQSFSIKDAQGVQQSGVNLVVLKPGTDPNAGAWLIGAHYDTVGGSKGADDNATGVAAVMEVARLLKDVPLEQTLRFVFFDQEESGLLGSTAYARSDTRIAGLKGAIIAEMLGYRCVVEGCQRVPASLPFPAPKTGDFAAVIGDTPDAPGLPPRRAARHARVRPARAGSRPDHVARAAQRPRPLLGSRRAGADGHRHSRPAKPALPPAGRRARDVGSRVLAGIDPADRRRAAAAGPIGLAR